MPKNLFLLLLLCLVLLLTACGQPTAEESLVVDETAPIQWQEPALEALVREALGKPEGEIYPTDLDHIWGVELFGESHIFFNAEGGYNMYATPDGYYEEQSEIQNPNQFFSLDLGSYLAIILPGIFNPFGTFLIRQYLKGLPKEYVEGLSGGEATEITVQNTSDLYDAILPNSAIRMDTDGEYVLYVEKVEGFWRDAYYARYMSVIVREQNNYQAGVSIPNEKRLPVIINSDRAISEGDQVRLVSGSDLLETR